LPTIERVLVTGATGFIGGHCLPELLRLGAEVHAVSSSGRRTGDAGVVWHDLDLLTADPAALLSEIRPTHLLHLAWYAEPRKFWSSMENVRWVAASLRLLEAFASAGGRRVVVAGTCAEYDWTGDGRCDELTTTLRPVTTYGICKDALRRLVEAYCRETGLSWAWGRVFLLYGPHEDPRRLVSSTIRSLLAGATARCTHGRQIRDFLNVRDVASGFAALAASDVQGPVNIASCDDVTIEQVVRLLGEIVGRPELVELGAIPAPAGDPARLTASTTRLFEEVGWRPRRALREGLEETVDWWRGEAG